MIANARSDVDEALILEAASWRVRLTEDRLDSCEEFELWYADAANAEAWDAVQDSWDYVGDVATTPGMMSLRAQALERGAEAARSHAFRRFRPMMAALLGMLVLGLTITAGMQWLQSRPEVYVTAQRERKTIQLSDMSRVSLDAGTELRVHFTDGVRRLELVSGQARFDVAKDVQRPFIVNVNEQAVVATGTSFNIDRLDRKTLVTLLEGKVTVLDVPGIKPRDGAKSAGNAVAGAAAGRNASPSAPSSMDMQPGQQLEISANRSSHVRQVDPKETVSWQSGELFFKDVPLPDAALRVSRYAATDILVEGAARDKRVSGVFKVGDTAAFVGAVTTFLAISASTDSQGVIILK